MEADRKNKVPWDQSDQKKVYQKNHFWIKEHPHNPVDRKWSEQDISKGIDFEKKLSEVSNSESQNLKTSLFWLWDEFYYLDMRYRQIVFIPHLYEQYLEDNPIVTYHDFCLCFIYFVKKYIIIHPQRFMVFELNEKYVKKNNIQSLKNKSPEHVKEHILGSQSRK